MSSMHAPRSANPVDSHVGSKIRLRRQVLKMSQEKLGESLGVTFQQVQKYERGANRVGASRLYKLSQVLDVPIGFFFEGIAGADVVDSVAEGEQPPITYDFVNSPDGQELITAFARIKSDSVKRQIIELARSFANAQDAEDS